MLNIGGSIVQAADDVIGCASDTLCWSNDFAKRLHRVRVLIRTFNAANQNYIMNAIFMFQDP